MTLSSCLVLILLFCQQLYNITYYGIYIFSYIIIIKQILSFHVIFTCVLSYLIFIQISLLSYIIADRGRCIWPLPCPHFAVLSTICGAQNLNLDKGIPLECSCEISFMMMIMMMRMLMRIVGNVGDDGDGFIITPYIKIVL